jgi:hypothetical protein
MTYWIHDPPSEWLREEDPGESGSLMTLAMAEGLAHLVYELKVSLEETATNNYVYLARREMEFAITSRTILFAGSGPFVTWEIHHIPSTQAPPVGLRKTCW